jgi:hypothetical protein
MTSRHHHYLSQCYLKGFTNGWSKNSRLVVIDTKQRKYFETIPRNVGGLKDFNRIDVPGTDPNAIEDALSRFESTAVTALKKVNDGAPFEGDARNTILNLIALLAIRSPERREQWRRFRAEVVEKAMDLALSSREIWESQLKGMRTSEGQTEYKSDYEEVRRFFDSKEYTITVSREHHIRTELLGMETILPLLDHRNWIVIRTSEDSGPFVTSDHPVILIWNNPDTIPPFYRGSPGFGMKTTQVYFPLSQNTAIVGEFEGRTGDIIGTRDLISALNSRLIHFAYKQIYAPKLGFTFQGEGGSILDGQQLLKLLGI